MRLVRPTHALIEGFPKDVTLEDGLCVTLRPLRSSDQAALLAFFRAIPEADRWWLREDVGSPAVVRRWTADLDYDRVFPLIALVGDRIIADATLHRRGFGAHNHLGEVRVVVAPEYRGRGLAYALLAEIIDIATTAGLTRLEAEIVSGAQAGALEAIELLGFDQVAVVPDHLYGPDDKPHDLIFLVYNLPGNS